MPENQKRIFSVAYLPSHQREIQRAYNEGDLEKAADLLRKMPKPSPRDFSDRSVPGEIELQAAQYLRVQAEGWSAITATKFEPKILIEYRGQGTPRVIEEKLARLEKYEELGEPSDIESQQGELEYLNEAIRVLDIFS